jgi:nitroreductase
MDFSELINQRYSVRAYKPDFIEKDKLQFVLQAAQLAPTAANRQPFRLIIIHTKGREQELSRIYAREWFVQAPIVICVVTVSSQAWVRRDGKNYGDVDSTIAMDHLILAAASVGLGTCWVANFDPAAARQVLSLPDEAEPVAFTPLGYPADEIKPKKRKALEELIRWERW